MFHGVVHKNLRIIIKEWMKHILGEVFIGCAGNFTIPSVLRLNGYKGTIHFCVVSLYSSLLGYYLCTKNEKAKYFYIGTAVGAVIGGAIVFLVFWFKFYHTAKIEKDKVTITKISGADITHKPLTSYNAPA